MFERYTLQARRAVFFARQEAAEFGSSHIEPAHLLLGILRESGELMRLMAGNEQRIIDLKSSVEKRLQPRTPGAPMSHDLPISRECMEVLTFAAEEARRARSSHIGPEYLIFGLLSENGSEAADLAAAGITIQTVQRTFGGDFDPGAPNLS